MTVRWGELWHKPSFAAILVWRCNLVWQQVPFTASMSPFLSCSYILLSFPPCCVGNPRESKPSQQHSLKCLGGKKTPQAGVSPRENHGYHVGPSPASQHGPTATATPTSPDSTQGECATPPRQVERKATYSGPEEVGKCWVSAVHK